MGRQRTRITPQHLCDRIAGGHRPVVLDVRRRAAFTAAVDMIPSATWRDPSTVETWGCDLPDDAEIVVYCVHGHEVSQGAAAALRALGLSAVYLDGGIEGYRAAGGALAPKTEPAATGDSGGDAPPSAGRGMPPCTP